MSLLAACIHTQYTLCLWCHSIQLVHPLTLVWAEQSPQNPKYQPIRVCGNQMFDNTGSGIGVHSHSNAVIENNTVYNSGQSGVYFSDFALVRTTAAVACV